MVKYTMYGLDYNKVGSMAKVENLALCNTLKKLVPMDSFGAKRRLRLMRDLCFAVLDTGQVLFRQNENDTRTVFLVTGRVELLQELLQTKQRRLVVEGGTKGARHPLSNGKPRQHTARALGKVEIAHIDNELLDKYVVWDQLSRNVTGENDKSNQDTEWMFQMLHARALMRVPPGNIPRLLSRFQERWVAVGEKVIEQGKAGDYYYVIKTGRFQVVRENVEGERTTLAELSAGDAFGEESLITYKPRNAHVVAVEQGALMCLSKGDFNALLEDALVRSVTEREAVELLKEGARLVDVRLESEYVNDHIEGSINIPLYILRLKSKQLDPKRCYILTCDTGARSATAAYLLTERGINACVLKGGVQPMFQLIVHQVLKEQPHP